YIKNLRTELIEPGRPFAAQVPIKASPDAAARICATRVSNLEIQSQLSCRGGEVTSHMTGLREAYDQQLHGSNGVLMCGGRAKSMAKPWHIGARSSWHLQPPGARWNNR